MSEQRPQTLFDKIWQAHVVETLPDGTALLYIDLHLTHEVTTPQAYDGLRAAGRKVRRPDATLGVIDHNIATDASRYTGILDPESRLQVETLQRNSEAFGVPLIPLLDERQGIGGGMIMPISQMIMAEVAGPRRMGRVMGIVVMPAMLAPILGPVVGGLILQNLHWSWIFFVNVPIGIIAGFLGWRMLPESDLGEAGKLDVLGLILLVTGMPLLVYGLSEIGTQESFTAPTVIWPIVASIGLLAAFGRHALRTARPLLDVRLYANRIFAAASLTTFGLGAALFIC